MRYIRKEGGIYLGARRVYSTVEELNTLADLRSNRSYEQEITYLSNKLLMANETIGRMQKELSVKQEFIKDTDNYIEVLKRRPKQ